MGDLLREARVTVRTALRRPGASIVIILTLGIGLGAATTVFSVFDRLVLGPLPFSEPDELIRLRQTRALPGQGVRAASVSGRNFTDWRESVSSIEDMAAARFLTLSLSGEGEPARVAGIAATWNHFSVLGVEPLLGRTFGPDEDRAGAPEAVALLAHSLWTRRFGGDPEVVGEDLVIGGRPYRVVGVMPQGFRYPYSAEVWVPLGLGPESSAWDAGILNVSARLAEGATEESAREELAAVAARLARERPDLNRGVGIQTISLREEILEGMDEKVRALFWASVFVLLIATANVASMVLARAQRQRGELAVRLALGAGRAALVRPLLLEGLILALGGAVLGYVVAAWAAPPLAAMSPMDDVGDLFQEIVVGGRAAVFVVASAMAVTGLFTLPAVLRAVRGDPTGGVSRSRGSSSTGGRALNGLVVAEVAVAVVLLTGAGLMVESVRNLRAHDLGIEPGGLAVFAVSPSSAGYEEPEERLALMDAVVERVRAIPGVEGAAVTNFNPLRDQGWAAGVWPTDRVPTAEQSSITVNHRAVTPGFFQVAGIELLAGRGFRAEDDAGGGEVAVISSRLAQRLWPGDEAVGRTLRVGDPENPAATVISVVGVVEDVADFGDLDVTWYRPLHQDPSEFPTGTLEIFVRAPSAMDDAGGLQPELVTAVRAAVAEGDPTLPVFDIEAAPRIVRFERRMERFTTILLMIFAVAGLAMAAVGIYGVLSYVVGRRRREMGVRQALGAAPRDLLLLVLRGALGVTLLGLALGLGAAALLTRFLESFLFGVSPLDPGVFAAMATACLCIAMIAAAVPARRAIAVDPRAALAEE